MRLVSLNLTAPDARIFLISIQDDAEHPKKELILRLASCLQRPRVLDIAEDDCWYLWHKVKLAATVGSYTGMDSWLKLTVGILALYPSIHKQTIIENWKEEVSEQRDTSESPTEDNADYGA